MRAQWCVFTPRTTSLNACFATTGILIYYSVCSGVSSHRQTYPSPQSNNDANEFIKTISKITNRVSNEELLVVCVDKKYAMECLKFEIPSRNEYVIGNMH